MATMIKADWKGQEVSGGAYYEGKGSRGEKRMRRRMMD
jgi:hypothetical protein